MNGLWGPSGIRWNKREMERVWLGDQKTKQQKYRREKPKFRRENP